MTEVKDATSRRKGLSLHSLLASLYPGSEVTVFDFVEIILSWAKTEAIGDGALTSLAHIFRYLLPTGVH